MTKTRERRDKLASRPVGDWIVEDPEDNSIRYFGGVYERTYTYSGDHITEVRHRGSGAGFGGDREIDAYGRLESVDEVAVEYDGIGNRLTVVTAAGVLSAKYDLMSRLRELSSGEGLVVKYNYRPDGLVYERQVTCGGAEGCSPEHQYYIYDESGNLAQVFDANPNPPVLMAQYYYAGEGDVPIAADLRVGSELERYHFIVGRTGSIEGLLDVSTGSIVERVAYDAFGGPIYEENGLSSGYGNVLGFQSHLWDPVVGLYLARARAYNPYTGLFLQVDPSDYADAVNLYAGFANDPVNNRDPKGEEIICPEGEYAVFMPVGGVGTEVCSGKASRIEEMQRNRHIMSSMANIASGIVGTLTYAACILFVDDPAICDAISGLGAAVDQFAVARTAIRQPRRVPSSPRKAVPTRVEGMSRTASKNVCFVAGTLVLTGAGGLPIEEVEVGDRVLTSHGLVETSVDETWWSAQLTVSDEANRFYTYEVELLRPQDWFVAHGVEGAGDNLFVELPELGVSGWGVVTNLRSDVGIASGPGRVVLMTVNSLSNDVYEVGLGDGVAPLRGTGSHPLYSLDRDDWVRVRDLRVGERLQTAEGAVSVEALEKVRGLHRVFNLEVEGDHEYLVGDAQIRAHNQKAIVDPKKWDYLFGRAAGAKNAAHNVSRTAQNWHQLGRVGVHNNASGRALLQSHFKDVVANPNNITRTFTNKHGLFEIRESLFSAPGGFLKLETTWQIMENGARRFTTMIPKGGF